MKYNFTYLRAICQALLQKDSKICIVTKNEKNVRPTIYFNNGSYIKTIMPNSAKDNCRGKRASIVDWDYSLNLSEKETDEILNSLKG